MFIFSTYLLVFLLKFQLGELFGCGIKFRIQRVPTWHTFDGPRYPKNKKYLEKWNDDIIIPFFQVFLVFGVAGSVKSMPSGYSLDAEFVIILFFQVFLVFGVARSVKSMPSGYSLEVEFNFASKKLSRSKLE